MSEPKAAFTFFRSYYESARELPDEQRLALYDAIINSVFEGVEPEVKGIVKALYILIKPVLSKSEARSTAGKSGGLANKKQSVSKPKAKTKQTLSDKDKDTDKDLDKDIDTELKNIGAPNVKPKKAKPEKIQFADFVSMTNDEYSSLVAKIGEAGTVRCIEILDNYKGANNKKYASDYRAILNWVVNRYEEEKLKGGVKNGAHNRDNDRNEGNVGGELGNYY